MFLSVKKDGKWGISNPSKNAGVMAKSYLVLLGAWPHQSPNSEATGRWFTGVVHAETGTGQRKGVQGKARIALVV